MGSYVCGITMFFLLPWGDVLIFCLETKERTKEKFKADFFLLLVPFPSLKGRNSLRSNSLPFLTLRSGLSLNGEKSRPGPIRRGCPCGWIFFRCGCPCGGCPCVMNILLTWISFWRECLCVMDTFWCKYRLRDGCPFGMEAFCDGDSFAT